MRSAVQAFLNQDIPIAILPLGTFNLFAKELGYPADIAGLFEIVKNNKVKLIDVAEVNNQIFLNHSTVGFYARIMKMRQKHPKLLTKNKALKILFNMSYFFNELPLYNVTLKSEDKEFAQKICLLVVGNNAHSTDIINTGDPVSFAMGRLEVLVINCKTRWELFKCVLMLIFFKTENNKYISKFSCENLSVSRESKLINVVMDGDLFELESPLSYSINHKQLSVFIP